MPKNRKLSEREALEREFLADLKRIENEFKKTGPKNRNTERKRKGSISPVKEPSRSKRATPVRINRSGRTNTPSKTKQVSKVPLPVPAKQVRPGAPKPPKRVAGSVEVSRTKRTDQKIHLTFKGVRSVENKIRLLSGQGVDKVLKQQFKRKGGEPPLGLVVTITAKNGDVASDVAPPDMVINSKNVKEFTERFIRSLRENNLRFRERNRNISDEPKDKGPANEKGTGYDNFNPENASIVTLKFIYGKQLD